MSSPNDHTSAELPEPEPSVPLLQEMQEPLPSLRGGIDARDIRAKNVVSGSQTIIEQQTIYQGSSPPAPRQTPIFMAADLPADFVARPHEFEALKKNLLQNDTSKLIAITSTLIGAGGYGKTMLALAICYDKEIQARFSDGILWVTLGEQQNNLIGKIEGLVYTLRRERLGVSTVETATVFLKEALANQHYLLVIDDVWHSSDLIPFLQGAPNCSRLVTTRMDHIIPRAAWRIPVDAMSSDEAVRVLQTGLERSNFDSQEQKIFQQLAARLGEWALLLALANGVLRQRTMRLHEPLPSALAYLQLIFKNRGVVAFDAKDADERREAVARTLEVSLDQLGKAERERYEECAIFPEDARIPLETLSQLWQVTGHLDAWEADELCQRFYDLSLLETYNREDPTKAYLRLHDIMRGYLQVKAAARLPMLHQQFLDTYALPRWADLSSDEPYLWDHLVEHLLATRHQAHLLATVKDIRYIAAKVFVRGTASLEQDLGRATRQAPNDTELVILSQQVKQIAHLLRRGQTIQEVEGVLLSRLRWTKGLEKTWRAWEQEAHHPLFSAWYLLPDLQSPTMLRALEGHTGGVNSCAISPDGSWLVSVSYKSLKSWDIWTRKLRLTLKGHADWVNGCAISPDGSWLVSASADETLKVWDAHTGEERLTLEGHTDWVRSCAISPDGSWLVSASADKTLKVWDVHHRYSTNAFYGEGKFSACAFHPDGKHLVAVGELGVYFLCIN